MADDVDLVEHAGGLDVMLMAAVVADGVVAAQVGLPTIRIPPLAGVPFVIAEATSYVVKEADELIYLQKEHAVQCVRDLYMSFPDVSREDVKNLLKESQSAHNLN